MTANQSGETLLPCPFCGGLGMECHNGDIPTGMYLVLCARCNACPGDKNTREEAAEAWNRRAPSTHQADQCAHLHVGLSFGSGRATGKCLDCGTAVDLAASQAAAPDGSQWRPIETHDGSFTPVLVAAPVFIGAQWNETACQTFVGEATYKGDEPGEGWWWANTDSEYGEQIAPTHWMPLPAAPEGV